MEAIQVIDSTHLVPLPTGQTVMVGAPPEALKVLVLWEFPSPGVVVLPPDPLYAEGLNQASFEFLLYNHMFRMNGLRDRKPFVVVCDPEQKARVEELARHTLRGPTDAQMAAWRTPAHHRKQLLLEMDMVSGEVARLDPGEMLQVVAFKDDIVELADGTVLERLPYHELRIRSQGDSIVVSRKAQPRAPLPLYFAEVDRPVVGPRFGLQVIGSASGFSGSEWGSCFLVWINGQPLVVDGTPYLDDHLRLLGIEDDSILGYLITHNHEDHANALSQLVGRRTATVLTSGPVMCGLVSRMAAILDCPEEEVRRFFRWVPLHPGLEDMGEALHWFGAEIRTWYSVHTIPTLGVEISMDGKRIRMPGDTLWGRQLDPLLEQGAISPKRYELIQNSYRGADIIVADAGGGPVHPDPQEVHELVSHSNGCRLMVTHIPEFARPFLSPAEPGTTEILIPREDRTPEEAMSLFGSPVFRDVPPQWLLALLYGGEVVDPPERSEEYGEGAVFVLSGCMTLLDGGLEQFTLQRGDLYHPELTPWVARPELLSTARWTRLLRIPEALYRSFVRETGIRKNLERLYRTRIWWMPITGQELGLDTLVELGALCRERRFSGGTPICRQGEPAQFFYIVTDGQVEVLRENGGAPRLLGSFGPGFHFGELALLGEEVRTATVRAAEATTVLELPARAFRRQLLVIPLARYHIHREAEKRKAELMRRPAAVVP